MGHSLWKCAAFNAKRITVYDIKRPHSFLTIDTDTTSMFLVNEQLLHTVSPLCSLNYLLFCLLWAYSTFLLVVERSCNALSRKIDDMQETSGTCEQWNPPSYTSTFNVSS